MPRLIDADALLMDNSWAFYDENGNRNDACIAVENAPTVDAEPVVRCKDCIDAIYGEYGLECNYHGRDVGENDYCVWGERKDEERLVMPPADGSTIKMDEVEDA